MSDHINKVELIGYYGSDELHACSAWTSTSRELTPDKIKRIPKMLATLADAEHHTPFEKSALHFLVNSEIASHIHKLKHRIGVSINGECLTGDSKITFVNSENTTNSKLKCSIKDLYLKWTNGRPNQNTSLDVIYSQKRIKNRKLRVLNEISGEFECSYIKDVWEKGVQDVYEIVLENGSKLKFSENHSIYTKDGYKTLTNGLSKKDLIAVNGEFIEISGKPYTFKQFYEGSELLTRKEFATKVGFKYELIKKWGYILEIKFLIDSNKDYKKGSIPWNKNKEGTYSIDIKNRKHNPKRGKDSHFWRGGVSKDRNLIGAWTTQQASKVHKKYNFTCQHCGNGGNLHAHHIIPVSTNIELAYEFSNLVTVCQRCHSDIHKNNVTEQAFAKKILSGKFVPLITNWGLSKKKRIGNKLKVNFVKIKTLEYVGTEMTYDIEVGGIHNNYIANNIVVHNSSRYKELKEDKYYIPIDWPQTWQDKLKEYTELGLKLYHECLADLTDNSAITRKRAKESARFFRTYNTQIECDIMFNFRSFYHFQSLRNKPEAQLEIQQIADEMLTLVKNIEGNPFQHTLAAFKL